MSTENTLKEREEMEKEYLQFIQELRRKKVFQSAPNGYAEVKPHDHPTLSDFDKVRLETALKIMRIEKESYSESIKSADFLIELILTTPFGGLRSKE